MKTLSFISLLLILACSDQHQISTSGLQGGFVKGLEESWASNRGGPSRTPAETQIQTTAPAPKGDSAASEPANLPKIEVVTESKNGKTYWVVSPTKVKAGESYVLEAKNNLAKGP